MQSTLSSIFHILSLNILQWNLRTKATLGDKPFGLCREVGPCSEVLCQTPVFLYILIIKSRINKQESGIII